MTSEVPVLRSIVAVGAGFFAATVTPLGADIAFSRLPPDAFDAAHYARSDAALFIKLAYETAFALVAGYVTARLAIHKPLKHAMVMSGIVLLGRALMALATWQTLPAWFHISVLMLIVPAALLGAKIGELRVRSRQ